jgi:PilZ domain
MHTGLQPEGAPQLLVRVWGMNADGRPFFQNAHAENLTSGGAQLSGIEHPLQPGDTIGVQHEERKARFRVLNTRDAGLPLRTVADVELLPGQECPWPDQAAAALKSAPVEGKPESGKRQFNRFKVLFPLELRDERGGTAAMQTSASDISGRGCYVESRVPLPLGTPLSVTFWIDSEKISTKAVVRASDPGVGMGIEFIGLDRPDKTRLQKYLKKFAAENSEEHPA